MDKHWLNRMFEEAGLDPKRSREAARVVLERILRRDQGSVPPARVANLRGALVRDPMVSFNRIIGRGDGGLPFVDAEDGGLSAISLASAFTDAGIDPAVSTAYAKVVAEAFTPEDLYREVWRGLGRTEDVRLDELCRMDWTPLRSEFPDIRIQPSDQGATEVVPIFNMGSAPGGAKGHDPLDAGPPPRGRSGAPAPRKAPVKRPASGGSPSPARPPSSPAHKETKAAPLARRRRPTKPPKKS